MPGGASTLPATGLYLSVCVCVCVCVRSSDSNISEIHACIFLRDSEGSLDEQLVWRRRGGEHCVVGGHGPRVVLHTSQWARCDQTLN